MSDSEEMRKAHLTFLAMQEAPKEAISLHFYRMMRSLRAQMYARAHEHRDEDIRGVQPLAYSIHQRENHCWEVDHVVDGRRVEILTEGACETCRWYCDPDIGPYANGVNF